VETHLHDAGWIARDYSVRRDVLDHDGARSDDRPVTDAYARHDSRVIPQPDVVSDDGIAPVRKLELAREPSGPALPENSERISRESGHTVIAAVHYETHASADLAEASDDQPVALELEMVEHIALETHRVIGIIVIGVVADDNRGVLDYGLQENRSLHIRNGMKRSG